MRFLILFIITSSIVACSGNSEVSTKLSGSDSIIINFYTPGTENIAKSVNTAEKKAINRISEFIAAKETELFKCGYDGNILFFEKGKQVSDVSFKYSDEACRHFLLDVKGELVATKMSNESSDFLKSLSRGDSTYY